MLIKFCWGIYGDVTSWGELCLLFFVGTREEIIPQGQRAGIKEEVETRKQVTNCGDVRGCCLIVCNASRRVFTVISSQEVCVSISSSRRPPSHKWLRSKCLSDPARRAKGGVWFVARDSVARSEWNVPRVFVASGLARTIKQTDTCCVCFTPGTSGPSRV